MGIDYFQWGNELKTGLEEIDLEHKGLVEIINEILQYCFSSEMIDTDAIKNIHKRLSTYVDKHFKTEEYLMEFYSIDTRHRNMHMKAHTDFKIDLALYFADYSSLAQPRKLGEVAEFLIRWLSYHILSIDKSLVSQISYVEDDKLSSAVAYENDLNQCTISTEPLLRALKELFFIISEKNRELVNLNSILEEKVAQRTLNLQEAYDKLEYITMRDELTGLFNRRYAIASLDHSIGEWKRYHTIFSVLFIDADKFKSVNDQYGHEYGDKVLIWLSAYLLNHTRKTDILCRLGGDEFLIICNHCDANDAMQLAHKLTNFSNESSSIDICQFWRPSISIGVVQIDVKCQSGSDLLKMADSAMYISKNSGGNTSNLLQFE